ncbi:hypothetical protein O3P69_012538 [Scylla paramamosain]|uniref:Uncharacterized protein n=1 Tax=Scylla paramamosain TaxID=85552 RepID=A0AAW0SHB2_SCYPA
MSSVILMRRSIGRQVPRLSEEWRGEGEGNGGVGGTWRRGEKATRHGRTISVKRKPPPVLEGGYPSGMRFLRSRKLYYWRGAIFKCGVCVVGSCTIEGRQYST